MAKPSVIVYGPPGCGKTTNKDRFKRLFGLGQVLDFGGRGSVVPTASHLVDHLILCEDPGELPGAFLPLKEFAYADVMRVTDAEAESVMEPLDQDALMQAYAQPGVRVAIDPATGPDLAASAQLFPWVRMTPEVPDKHPDQMWLLRGSEGSEVPGVTLGVFGHHLTRIDLGISISSPSLRMASCRAELAIDAAQARALAQALLSAAQIFEARLAAKEGGES